MSKQCLSRVCAWATEYGHSDWATGTVAYQCQKSASQGKHCGVCYRNGTAFGLFGKKVPDYALCDGKMDDGTVVKKGDALCWVVADPDMTDAGDFLTKSQEKLDDDYWQCDGDDDDEDGDDDGDDGDDEDEDDDDDEDDSSSSDDYKGIKVPALRKDLVARDLSAKGKRADLVARLVNNDNGTDDDEDGDDNEVVPTKGVAAKGVATKVKKTRTPSAYNLFMKEELPKYKKAHDTDHKDAFCACAAKWTAQKA